MSADFEMEKMIVDFLRQNGKSTVLTIFKNFGLNRSTANRHLYSLEKSQQVFKSDENPPVWDLMENKTEAKHTLKPELKSQTTRDSCEEIQEEHVRDLLKSGALKAHQIAKSLGQTPKVMKKQLYIMEKEGKVQKCKETSTWTLNDEESNGSYNQESSSSIDNRLGSNSGLSKSFDVITELGKGGFGCVYKVKHKFDGKIYAVKKVILTGKADSEVKALATVDHPNIVRYFTCWSDSENCTSNQDRNKASNTSRSSSDIVTFDRSGCEENDDDDDDDDDVSDATSGMASLGVTADTRTYLFIQMEFCEGGTLTTWINDRNYKETQRNTMDIYKIFYEIISGVEYIHSSNLIHRDLKPDNILFGSNGRVKIGDFGLVVHQTNDSGDSIKRSKGRGTPPYMSPEQGEGSDYDEKTDIFPLGLVWFEMLWKISTGRERAKLWPDLRNQRFPEGFCDRYPTENIFIKEMLSSKPEDRPQAKHIREKLKLFFSQEHLLTQKTI